LEEKGKLEKYSIVYNFYPVEGLGLILPTAIICQVDSDGSLGYMRAAAIAETVESYGLNIKDTYHEAMISLCLELTIPAIEAVFNKGVKRGVKPITSLFADADTKQLVQNTIDRRMSKLMTTLKENGAPICFNIERKIKAKDVPLFYYEDKAEPLLYFAKTQTGISYRLSLKLGDEHILPSKYDVQLIANQPGIVKIKNRVVWISFINANKLTPFIKSEKVFIPEKLTRTYFEKFIIDVLGKVNIEVDGFELNQVNTLKTAKIRCIYDFLKGVWVVDLSFDYDGFSFYYSDVNQRKTRLEFGHSGENDVVVYQCIRNNNAEEKYVDALQKQGFAKNDTKKFVFGKSTFDTIQQIGKTIDKLAQDFIIEPLDIDGKTITFSTSELVNEFKLGYDWFDLKGRIVIGGVEYPISAFFRNIRDKNPYFKLKDGTFYVLSAEMMAEYEHLVKFAQEDAITWRLAKQHFALIHEKDLAPATDDQNFVTEVEYKPSSKLQATLRPYQEEGVKWLIKHRVNGLGACLADDMGLGKTLQTIAVLMDTKEQTQIETTNASFARQLDLFGEMQVNDRTPLAALIILPASLVFNWQEELKKYAPSLHVLNYTGASRKKAQRTIGTFDVILTTYQTAVLDLEILKKQTFTYVILDESQQIRNKNSKVFKALHTLHTKYKISLSGTPIENSLSDLWSQMEFINPKILGSYAFFKEHFQAPIEKMRDAQAIQNLKTLVDPFILRRTKEQVAPDLPELIEKIHYSEMSAEQTKVFEREKSAVRNHLLGLDKSGGQYKIHVLASLTKLRQIANHPKLADENYTDESGKFDDITSQIQTIVRSNHKVLVFSSFKAHLQLVSKWLEGENIPYVLLTGDHSSDQRQDAVHSFQKNEGIQVFLISIKAGGTGLNLTAADYVFILDPWWNPFVERQAIARAHRIGQQNNVMVTRFISKNSIEEKILLLQESKKSLSSDIIDLAEMPDLSEDNLELLLG
jgi:SNF2 family DNA or RNA helicase